MIGAISTIETRQLEGAYGQLSSGLAGKLAGIVVMQRTGEPGAGADFWIRGVNTFGANSTPLILVDGVERDMDLVDVDDIASFSILKDATATALYGVRGLYIDKEFDALAEVIHAQAPDFVSINEVDSATNRSKGTIHPAELCKRLTALSGGKDQWKWNYAIAFQFGTPGAYSGVGTYGDAVLTKHPILESRDFQMLPDEAQGTEGRELRSVAAIRSKVDGREFWMVSTHLDHRGAELSRIYQAHQLKDILSSMPGRLFLAGDLNAVPTSETMKIIFGYTQKCYMSDTQYTFPSLWKGASPTSMIDYVMYRTPDIQVKCTGYKVIQNTASDHCAILATFLLN